MIREPPGLTRTDPPFPYPTLVLSKVDHVAIAAAPARLFDDASGGRVDRLSGPSGHVDPGVHRRTAVEGIVADAEVAGERIAAHRLQRGNGKHALFKRVELGPARKQLAKRRVDVLAHRFIRPAHRKLALVDEARRLQYHTLQQSSEEHTY